MNERIKKVRKALALTQQEFAEKIGSVQNTITGYETGRRTPSNQVISLICNVFHVNEIWLRTGEGEMFIRTSRNEEISAFVSEAPSSDLTLGERIKKARKTLGLTQQQFASRLRMKPNSISQVESGRNTSNQTILLICREFNISEEWLKTGNGEMFVQTSIDGEISAFFERMLSSDTNTFKKRFISALSRFSDLDWDIMERFWREINSV